MTRVLVVDDCPVVRELLVDILRSDPEIEIAGRAADGAEAVHMAAAKKPDVITMDLHMPNMDGFEATRRIMQTCPTPIVIISAGGDRSEVEESFRAIDAGALAIVQRPHAVGHAAHGETSTALIRTVKTMAEVKVVRRWAKDRRGSSDRSGEAADYSRKQARKLIALGASTGGPAVLREILAELPSDYPLPIVIVQHMAAGFVSGFAEWLASTTSLAVEIARHGAGLAGGRVYLAPDGFQMAITGDLRIVLAPGRPEHGMCPSVSHLFRSIHKDLCRNTVAVLLTGMGKDGALELKQLKENGAITIVQDRATAAVYGMPGEAIKQDAAMLILGPSEIGKVLRTLGQDMSTDFRFLGI